MRDCTRYAKNEDGKPSQPLKAYVLFRFAKEKDGNFKLKNPYINKTAMFVPQLEKEAQKNFMAGIRVAISILKSESVTGTFEYSPNLKTALKFYVNNAVENTGNKANPYVSHYEFGFCNNKLKSLANFEDLTVFEKLPFSHGTYSLRSEQSQDLGSIQTKTKRERTSNS